MTLSLTTLSHMDMVVVVVPAPRSTLHFTGIAGWVRLAMKMKTRGRLFFPTSQLLYAPEQPGVAIPIHQQITVQIPHAAQNFGEFALGESECFLKEDRVNFSAVEQSSVGMKNSQKLSSKTSSETRLLTYKNKSSYRPIGKQKNHDFFLRNLRASERDHFNSEKFTLWFQKLVP